MRTKLIIATAAACAAVAAGATIAVAGGDDGEGGATGPGAHAAAAAALALYPGATVNAVERDGEDGATWEVEVQRADGSTVDVRLDDQLKLVVAEADAEHDGD